MAEETVRLMVVDVMGSLLLEDTVLRTCKVLELCKRVAAAAAEGDWAVDEALHLGSERLDEMATLQNIPDGTTLCLVRSRRTKVAWSSSVEGVERQSVLLEGFEPSSVVKPPLVQVISGKGCHGGESELPEGVKETVTFEPAVEATEALAATPHFSGQQGWTLKFADGSSLQYRPDFGAGPLYTQIEGEERRIKTLGLEFVDEAEKNRIGWQVPEDWSYQPY
eukprot:TRINITY_DN102812_c0_g1_i1.p1 TRINITY_DN102812_c0_g1~~TRINITY_DN102812_c0_g1_i1.p1  ORF type:complete len:222 (+),score=50.65 TRINITY_DN102812_c0_g1_i1:54-719(+)